MARPNDYQVVTGTDPEDLRTNVNAQLVEGWELWEAGYYGSDESLRGQGDKHMVHCQPMIKFADSLTQGVRPFRLCETLTLNRNDGVDMTSS